MPARTSRACSGARGPAIVEVSAGVIESSGRFLIAQRRADQRLPLLWEFPGGKREAGESWRDCLARELREELGVEVSVGSLLDVVTHAASDLTVALRFFRCDLVAGTPRPLGCRDVRWVARHELAIHEFPEADAGLVGWLSTKRPLARVGFVECARSIDVPPGIRLEEAAARAHASLPFGCRSGICGACLVTVCDGAANLSPATRAERATLHARGAAPGQRLACQATVEGDVVVAHAETQFPFA